MKHLSLRIKPVEDQDEPKMLFPSKTQISVVAYSSIAPLRVDSSNLRRGVNFKLKYYLSIGLFFIALSCGLDAITILRSTLLFRTPVTPLQTLDGV